MDGMANTKYCYFSVYLMINLVRFIMHSINCISHLHDRLLFFCMCALRFENGTPSSTHNKFMHKNGAFVRPVTIILTSHLTILTVNVCSACV